MYSRILLNITRRKYAHNTNKSNRYNHNIVTPQYISLQKQQIQINYYGNSGNNQQAKLLAHIHHDI